MHEKLKVTQQFGFTLVEIMTVVIIGGILMAIALPNFDAMTKNNCMTVKNNRFVNSLQFARSEATKRNASVTLNASNAGDATNEWGTGWTIVDNTAAVIKLIELDCGTTTINETANVSSLTYDADGFIEATGTFEVCDDRTNETGKLITISFTGRPGTNGDYACP